MKNILLHACCGPCSLMPIKNLLEEGFNLTGYFYNPNIHMQEEYNLRLEAFLLATKKNIEFVVEEPSLQNLSLASPLDSLVNSPIGSPVVSPLNTSCHAHMEKFEPNKISPRAWLKELKGVYAEGDRCKICYERRMLQTAYFAKAHNFDAFTSSLLYSRYQCHTDICQAAENASKLANIPFLYRDFRPMWQAGIDLSKDWGLYRQKWCGCILSRAESLLRKKQK